MCDNGDLGMSMRGRMNLFCAHATALIEKASSSGALPARYCLSQYWWKSTVHTSCPSVPKLWM